MPTRGRSRSRANEELDLVRVDLRAVALRAKDHGASSRSTQAPDAATKRGATGRHTKVHVNAETKRSRTSNPAQCSIDSIALGVIPQNQLPYPLSGS